MWIFKCIEARESGVEFRFHLLHRFYEEARHVTIGEGIFTLFIRDYSFWKNLKDFLGDETGVKFTIILTCIRVPIEFFNFFKCVLELDYIAFVPDIRIRRHVTITV